MILGACARAGHVVTPFRGPRPALGHEVAARVLRPLPTLGNCWATQVTRAPRGHKPHSQVVMTTLNASHPPALPSVRGRQLLKIELAIRDWARREKAVAKRLRRIENRRMDYMRSLFGAFCADEEEVEVRCMLAFSMFIGSHFIAAEHGLRSRPDVLSLALKRLLA